PGSAAFLLTSDAIWWPLENKPGRRSFRTRELEESRDLACRTGCLWTCGVRRVASCQQRRIPTGCDDGLGEMGEGVVCWWTWAGWNCVVCLCLCLCLCFAVLFSG